MASPSTLFHILFSATLVFGYLPPVFHKIKRPWLTAPEEERKALTKHQDRQQRTVGFPGFPFEAFFLVLTMFQPRLGKVVQTKKYPFPRYISVFWEKSDFKFNQSNNLCTPSNNLAWLFKSGGDRVPIPLKNSEIVNKGNNKRQNVKISGNVLVKLFRFFGNRSNKMLKYREIFWFNYFVFFAAVIKFLQRSF